MAKKPKKAEAASETKSDALPEAAPNDAAAPAVATIPADAMPVKKRDIEVFLLIQTKERELETLCNQIDEVTEQRKSLKAEWSQLDGEIRRLRRLGPGDPTLSLFDKHDTKIEVETSGEVKFPWEISLHGDASVGEKKPGEANGAAPSVDESWKAAPLFGTLKQPKKSTLNKALQMLEKHGYETVGQLESLRAAEGAAWHAKVPGLGVMGRQEVDDAANTYLAETRDKAAFAAARGGEPKPAAVEFDSDQKFNILKVLDHNYDLGPKITAKKMAGRLKGSLYTAATAKGDAFDAAWSCDDVGIRVETYNGQAIPAERNLITYAEAVDIVKGVHGNAKPAAPQAPDSTDTSATVLAKYFIERWGIAESLDATDLQELIAPAAGTHLGIHWRNDDAGVHYSGVGIDGEPLLTYFSLSLVVNHRLEEMT